MSTHPSPDAESPRNRAHIANMPDLFESDHERQDTPDAIDVAHAEREVVLEPHADDALWRRIFWELRRGWPLIDVRRPSWHQ